MTYAGYNVFISRFAVAARYFNDGNEYWCNRHYNCDGNCSACLLCCTYGNRLAKERLFAKLIMEQGIEVSRPDVLDDLTSIKERNICRYCGSFHDSDEDLCPACTTDIEIMRCHSCGVYEHHGDLIQPHDSDHHYCTRCIEIHARTCRDCGRWFEHSDDDGHGHNLCPDCRVDYDTCDYCGRCIRRSTIRNRVICPSCEEEASHTIHRYSFKPSPKFYGDGHVYMGIELEAGDAAEGNRDECAEELAHLAPDLFYLKADGSIPNYGFELVTHPCTLEFHKSKFPWIHILSKMTTKGLVSHSASDDCGLHIHVNRNALTPNQWLLIDWFVSTEQSKWATIARRPANHYCRMKNKKKHLPLKDQYGYTDDRYYAVNFCNKSTVEFRLFRGTLRYSTLICTIALVDALVSWAKSVKVHDIICTGAWDSFVKHTQSSNRWADAINYLKQRCLL